MSLILRIEIIRLNTREQRYFAVGSAAYKEVGPGHPPDFYINFSSIPKISIEIQLLVGHWGGASNQGVSNKLDPSIHTFLHATASAPRWTPTKNGYPDIFWEVKGGSHTDHTELRQV